MDVDNSSSNDDIQAGVVLTRSELDLCTPPRGLDPIESSFDLRVLPMTSLDHGGPVQFHLLPDANHYTDLGQCTLTMVVQVVNADGSKIPDEVANKIQADGKQGGIPAFPDVTIPNNFFGALIRSIDVAINGFKVSVGANLHFPQVSTIINLLSYSSEYGEGILHRKICWEKDAGDEMRLNKARERYNFIKGSRNVVMVSELTTDVFSSVRLLPPKFGVTVTINRSSSEFALIKSKNNGELYKVRWLEAYLTTKRICLGESPHAALYRGIENNQTFYIPYSRLQTFDFEIPPGSTLYRANSILSGVLPTRVLLVFVQTESLSSGSWKNNPMIFAARKHKVSRIQFYLGSRQVLPEEFMPDWENYSYVKEYQALLNTTASPGSPGIKSTGVTYEAFYGDYAIFATQIRGFEGQHNGVLSCSVGFSGGAPQGISGLLIAEYQSSIVFDQKENKIHVVDY